MSMTVCLVQACAEALVVIATSDGMLRLFCTGTWTCVAVCRGPHMSGRVLQLASYR